MKGENATLIDFATPQSQVSAFCRAIISKVFPRELWGAGEEGRQTQSILMKNLDRFVKLGRFESLSLHTVTQGLKVRWNLIVARRS